MKYKRIMSIMAVAIMSFSMISCSTKNSGVSSEKNNGEEVVISTSVAVTEILDALGVKVSGVPTTSYDLPESTEGAIRVGNPMSPDLEIIKSLNPTVVVSVDTLGSDYINLFKENNIPNQFVSLESLDGLKETISALGERFNKEEKANEILRQISSKEDEVKAKAKATDNGSADILLLFAAPGSTMIATSKSYIGSLVELVGGHNIIEDNSSSFVTYNKEDLSMLNPDKILVMVHALPEETKAALEKEMATDSTWQRINAVKYGNVVYLDNEYFGMSANLKVIEGLDILSEIVHGDGE